MIKYEVTIRPDNGAIEFWTNDVELRLAVSKMIIDIAEDFSRQTVRDIKREQAESEDKE